MGIQSVIICKIINVWLFNDKKNAINKKSWKLKVPISSVEEFRE